ncbi:MAG: hypothetical protein EZS28_034565, partial [Streblomastix strix]
NEVSLYAVALIKTRSIYKTTSGNIQRRATKAAFQASELDEHARWIQGQAITNPKMFKSNVGHLETAADMAEIIKTALAIHTQAIPGITWLRKVNNAIAEQTLKLMFLRLSEPLPKLDKQQIPLTSVSAFGFGGSNAHVILTAALETGANQWPFTPKQQIYNTAAGLLNSPVFSSVVSLSNQNGDSITGLSSSISPNVSNSQQQQHQIIFLPFTAKLNNSLHSLVAKFKTYLQNGLPDGNEFDHNLMFLSQNNS